MIRSQRKAYRKALGRRLFSLRRHYKYSLQKIARFAGVTWITYMRWERGEGEPQARNLVALVESTRVDLRWLLTGDTSWPHSTYEKITDASDVEYDEEYQHMRGH